MSIISDHVVFAVNRVMTIFDNPSAPLAPCPRSATGFWVSDTQRRKAFILNKHSVSPALAFREPNGLSLKEISLELRFSTKIGNQVSFGSEIEEETKFFKVNNFTQSLIIHETADCAALIDPELVSEQNSYIPIPLRIEDIANQAFLASQANIMDLAFFIGYPGNQGLWDEKRVLPIARLSSLASMPHMSFTNSLIETADVGLVAGLSFGGSSGSPLWLRSEPGVEPKLIGLMSGHSEVVDNEKYELRDNKGTVFTHMGLSWYTRSTAILELLIEQGGMVI